MPLRQLPPDVERTFAAGGATGALMREVDWAATAIGPPGEWPQSLRTAVSVCLESRFPMLIWWGPELVKLYNDAYAAVIGSKHPRALGQRGIDTWPEIWETIGPMLDGVLAGRGATYSEDQLLMLVRHGFPEECYFTFSYSPIRDESGGVGGVFTAVTETTARVLGARRLATLRSLAQRMLGAASADQVLASATEVLDTAGADVPCAVVYQITGGVPQRAAATDDLTSDEFSEVDRAVATSLVDPPSDGTHVRLPRPVGVRGARDLLVLPIEAGGSSARLVAGTSPALLLDEDYRSFFSLIAGQVSVALSEALGYEAARARAQALAELDRAKTTFFANISHEFRTPLTLILGPVEDALADDVEPLGERQRARSELLRRNAMRLLKLVNTLLDFARLESGRATARYEPVELGAFTADLASVFRSAAEQAGLAYDVDCPPVREPVYVDREMWEKAVLNLLSNALKFTFEGSIAVRLREDDEAVTLRVTDTGVGIDPKDQASLFQRFHRVQDSRSRSFEGSGIGLALVAEVAELHGGNVSVSSAPGEGSSFTLRVPFGTGHLPAEHVHTTAGDAEPATTTATTYAAEALQWVQSAPAEPAAAPEPGSAPAVAGPRVMVVDDSADMRDYVVGLLSGDYHVETAPDGMTALEAIRRSPPDLVMADVMMPRLDGFGLLAALRDDPRTAGLPVILLSARAGEEAAVEGLDAGADDYLTKPFTARELRARIRTLLALDSMRHEVVAREHVIADTLQHSLLPTDTHQPGDLEVSSYYRASTDGAQVGGDWYDVIQLGADRTGLVIGDVMGRGVHAAAVMGQVRAAIRAYAQLDLPPAQLLEQLDGVVRDFGDEQIATCVYAVYEPADRTLTYANAGHLPPLLSEPREPARPLVRSLAPPLGTGQVYLDDEVVRLRPGATLTLYTDGLVERRDSDIDTAVRALARRLTGSATRPLSGFTTELVGTPDAGAEDDIALLMVRLPPDDRPDETMKWDVGTDTNAVAGARRAAARTLLDWSVPPTLVDDVRLVVSEMVTNALRHGRPPVSLRLRRTPSALVVEVWDGAAFLPRRLRPTPEDESGRGVQLVALLADRWGARPTGSGKATWCMFRLDRAAEAPSVATSSG